MPDGYSGGCQCGKIRFQITGSLGIAAICHCRMCQKAFGSWGAPLVEVTLSHLHWTRGTPSVFHSSAVVNRGFCRDCGTPLYMYEHGDDYLDMAMGCFDTPHHLGPLVEQIGVEARVPWFTGIEQLPHRETCQTRSTDDLLKLKSFQHPDYDTDAWP